VYGVEWLVALGLGGLGVGLVVGLLMARGTGRDSRRVQELEAQLAASREELDGYRREVVAQFRETARKFQSLNDSYTDLHQHLARSSSILCGDVAGPLLQAPAGHQDLLAGNRPASETETRANGSSADEAAVADTTAAAASADAATSGDAPQHAAPGDGPAADDAIRVAEPVNAPAEGATADPGPAAETPEEPASTSNAPAGAVAEGAAKPEPQRSAGG
jgi:uncharacterized membrane-anchored protein YhcB (DUF1043 family)